MTFSDHPVLTCDEARLFEQARFAGDEAKEWTAMQAAGAGVAGGIMADFKEIGGMAPTDRALVLVGKGHNGGDALLAAKAMVARFPDLAVEVGFVFGERTLRPLAVKAWRELMHVAPARLRTVPLSRLSGSYALILDGVFGFQFRPPLDERTRAWLARVNALSARLRAAVDLPSGLDDPDAFRADFTYATGSVKAPLLDLPKAGRLRYVDLGFSAGSSFAQATDWVVGPEVLAPLTGLRDPDADKRTFGHLFVLGGSRSFPGAVLMSVLAALRSGVGLVTAFVPESLSAAFAARAPEAMWVGWPETPDGGLAMEGMHLWRNGMDRATAFLIGPGLGREPETLAMTGELVRGLSGPCVLDADALRPEIVSALAGAGVLTPHAGEFARIAGSHGLREFGEQHPAKTVVLKGPVTRICDGRKTYHSFYGGPVLARGGSGDLLAGLIGGLLAQHPADSLGAAIRGVVWHGRAADRLACALGQVAVRTTDVLDYLPEALRPR